MMEELKALLRYAFQTENALTFPVSGPGSVGMEMLLRQHGRAGRQGHRLPQRRVRRPHDRERRALRRHRRWWSRTPGATPVDPNKVEDALQGQSRTPGSSPSCTPRPRPACSPTPRRWSRSPSKHDALDHRRRGDLARRHAGAGRRMGHRRGLLRPARSACRCTPGLSPVSFSDRVVEHVKARKDKVHSWFMDMNLLLGYWGADHAHLPPHRADQRALRACTRRC
ncbi:MAG: hypothetical protein MZW92_77925 [Comamonadaceae bacterium]|nr:hypothetical protein [Comamonadaceae bacterium]